jgi:phasin family protein
MAVIEAIKDKADFLKEKAGSFYSSAYDLNKLTIDKFEETSKIGLESAAYFSGIGFKQLRAASSVKDVESLREFTAGSITLSGEIAKKVLDDGKALLGLGAGVKDKITSMFPSKEEVVKKKTTTKPVSV